MPGGAWGTGTWDSAQWDSLPVTGNAATGGVGSLGLSDTRTTSGVSATGAVGTAASTVTLAIAGVQAQGQVGSEGEAESFPISGVVATGQVGTVTPSVRPILLDDTHDGDRQKKRFAKEVEEKERRKRQLIATYEDLLESKPEVAAQIVAPFVLKTPKKTAPAVDFEGLLADLNRVEALYREHQEMDDEEVLLLL